MRVADIVDSQAHPQLTVSMQFLYVLLRQPIYNKRLPKAPLKLASTLQEAPRTGQKGMIRWPKQRGETKGTDREEGLVRIKWKDDGCEGQPGSECIEELVR